MALMARDQERHGQILPHFEKIGSVRVVEFRTDGMVKEILYDAFGNAGGAAGGDADWYGYCLDDPFNGRDPDGLELVGSQVRKGDDSTLYYYDPDTGDNFLYDLKEPAPKVSPNNNEEYGPNAKLPPGDYEKKPMPYSGKVMKAGHPLYTTPGSPAGIVKTPKGTTRTVIGAHKGKKSEKCPLFDARKAGAKERSDSLNMLEQYHMPRGGVRVRVREEDEN